MSAPTVIVLVLTGQEICEVAAADPVAFVESRTSAMDAAAQQQTYAQNRFAVSQGSTWRLIMPDDRDTSTVHEMYGHDAGALVDAAIRNADQLGVPSLIAWKVFETIPRGQG